MAELQNIAEAEAKCICEVTAPENDYDLSRNKIKFIHILLRTSAQIL